MCIRDSSITHPSKGPGLVIAVNTLFGRGYAHVFFQRTKETLTLPVDDLVICEPPEVRLQKGLYSSADRFLLRLLLEKIRDLKSGTEPVSYTHLDVYKRQDRACTNNTREFRRQVCNSYGCCGE